MKIKRSALIHFKVCCSIPVLPFKAQPSCGEHIIINVMLSRCSKTTVICTTRAFVQGPAASTLVGQFATALEPEVWVYDHVYRIAPPIPPRPRMLQINDSEMTWRSYSVLLVMLICWPEGRVNSQFVYDVPPLLPCGLWEGREARLQVNLKKDPLS